MKAILGILLGALALPLLAATTPQDAMLSHYAYPYPVRTFALTAQQQPLQMAYMDVPPASGKAPKDTVVLLHGKNFSGAYWQRTIKALSQAGYRVIAPDQLGFGKSSKPTEFQYSFQALATYTHQLLASLGVQKAVLVGHSMGGMLASRYSLMFPEDVSKLVLVNPIGLEDWKRQVPYQSLDDAIAAEHAQTPESVKNYMTKAYFDGKWQPQYEPLLAIQAGWTIGPDAGLMATVDALTSDMIFTQPVLYEFPDIKAKTLLIIGTRDRTAIGRNRADAKTAATMGRYDVLGKVTAKAIPQAQLVELPGIGHVPQFEDFDDYIKALERFLAQ